MNSQELIDELSAITTEHNGNNIDKTPSMIQTSDGGQYLELRVIDKNDRDIHKKIEAFCQEKYGLEVVWSGCFNFDGYKCFPIDGRYVVGENIMPILWWCDDFVLDNSSLS